MKICYSTLIIAVFLSLVFISFYSDRSLFLASASSVNITAVVISNCGNSVIDSGEDCDGLNLNSESCESLGFTGGVLNCSYCVFDTSGCTGPPITPVGGRAYSPSEAIVIFEGKASPQSIVTVLKDGQMSATTTGGNDANFQITLSGLSGGSYIFGFYSEDKKGIRSSLLVFSINVTAGATTKVSGVFIAPTLVIDKEEVKKGEDVLIFGESVPKADIRISVKSKDKEFSVNTVADSEGKYSYSLNTDSFDFSQCQVTVIAFVDNLPSNISKIIYFIIGTETVFRKVLPEHPLKGDFNDDSLVNLVDFSILLYWFDYPNPSSEIDLNKDNKIDLVDFSIMAYYWTG